MTILKIIETLQIYSEDFIAYKLDGGFANAVTEAVSLLIGQGEQIADLQNELRDERWIPVTERMPEKDKEVLCLLDGEFWLAVWDHCDDGLWTDGERWVSKCCVAHWMLLPKTPKEEYNE
jgi:hypothetical protein